jgi:hypothetical protein
MCWRIGAPFKQVRITKKNEKLQNDIAYQGPRVLQLPWNCLGGGLEPSVDDAARLAPTFWSGVASGAFPASACATFGPPPPKPSRLVSVVAFLVTATATTSLAVTAAAASLADVTATVSLATASTTASSAATTGGARPCRRRRLLPRHLWVHRGCGRFLGTSIWV